TPPSVPRRAERNGKTSQRRPAGCGFGTHRREVFQPGTSSCSDRGYRFQRPGQERAAFGELPMAKYDPPIRRFALPNLGLVGPLDPEKMVRGQGIGSETCGYAVFQTQ